MRVVVQRVLSAEVRVNNVIVGSCNHGYMLLVGFTAGDNEDTASLMAQKIATLRIFEDDMGKMNLSLTQIGGEILSISQFTLYADTTIGRRPSFIKAMEPIEAERLYCIFNKCLSNLGFKVGTGVFGGDMKVALINDGPVTILIDSMEFPSSKLRAR